MLMLIPQAMNHCTEERASDPKLSRSPQGVHISHLTSGFWLEFWKESSPENEAVSQTHRQAGRQTDTHAHTFSIRGGRCAKGMVWGNTRALAGEAMTADSHLVTSYPLPGRKA